MSAESLFKEDEDLDTSRDKDKTLLPRFSVALSSLSRLSLAGAEKECDPRQEEI